jgi:PAS domain S-box-containing protein
MDPEKTKDQLHPTSEAARRLRRPGHLLTALPPWAGYLIAVAATVGTLLARLSLGHAPGDPPTLVLFIIPIVLSSYLGGLGPGLLSTAIAGLTAAYFLLPPFYSFAIADPRNEIQLYCMVLAGILVSMLVEKLRRIKKMLEAEITKRTQFEEALKESEERFRQAFEQDAMGIFHTGADGFLRHVNQKFCDFTGYAREELAKMTFRDIVHPEDLADIEKIHGRLISGEMPSVVIQKRYRRKDGSYVMASCLLSAPSPAIWRD